MSVDEKINTYQIGIHANVLVYMIGVVSVYSVEYVEGKPVANASY